jgi:hypothetical protein
MKNQDDSLDSVSKQKVTVRKQAIRTSAAPRKEAGRYSAEMTHMRGSKKDLLWLGLGLSFVLAMGLISLLSGGAQPEKGGTTAQIEEALELKEVPLVDAVAVSTEDSQEKPSEDKKSAVESKLADGENARHVIAELKRQDGEVDMDALFKQAEDFHASAQPTDAYLLYFYLAKKGHGPSAMALAVTSDPIFYTRTGALNSKPDPFQAFKWYRYAVKAGVPQAQKNLDTLKENIEAIALSGDRSAQRLLLQWQ